MWSVYKKFLKWGGLPLFSLMLLGSLSSCYYIQQGMGLWQLYSQRQAISAILKNPKSPKDLKTFLNQVNQIRYFAKGLGLKVGQNYTQYVTLDKDFLTYVLSASPPLQFKTYLWNYPLVGRLPYRGFFKKNNLEQQVHWFESQGYEVSVRPVDAFSTLGWLSDPIFSYMRHWSLYELSSTLIHESTHATLFIASNANFNESLAQFVGDTGAYLYIDQTLHEGKKLKKQLLQQKVSTLFFNHSLLNLYKDLNILYHSMLLDKDQLAWKSLLIHNFQKSLWGSVKKAPKINNAFILAYLTYLPSVNYFKIYYLLSGSNLKTFIAKMETLQKDPHPQKTLIAWVKKLAQQNPQKAQQVKKQMSLPIKSIPSWTIQWLNHYPHSWTLKQKQQAAQLWKVHLNAHPTKSMHPEKPTPSSK